MPRSEASRQKILAAAIAIAAERGYEGTTISRVTARSGLPASSLYWHFGDKDGLLAAAVDESFREWRENHRLWSEDAEPDDLGDALRRMLAVRLDSIVDGNVFFCIGTMLTLEARDQESAARVRFQEIRAGVTVAMRDWYSERIAAELQERDPALIDDLVDLTTSFIQGVFLAHRSGSHWPPTSYLEPMVQVVLARVEASQG